MAEHAGEEEAGAEHAELQRELVREPRVGERPRHHAERRGNDAEATPRADTSARPSKLRMKVDR